MELAAYPVDLEEQPEGGFTVTFADVPEAITHGRDRDEALQEELVEACRRISGVALPD